MGDATNRVVVVAILALLGIVAAIFLTSQHVAPSRELVPRAPALKTQPVPDTGQHFTANGLAGLADPTWIERVSDETGIPQRALRAYAGADIAFRDDLPQCQLDWATLAGIGYVESRHGTLHGGHIDSDGQQAPPIYGIPLDGTSSAAVPDTDGGRLDGDSEWDRAVGPLQFIPSTWEYMGADGSLDGVKDPQHIDDAALAAARFLCRIGGDLSEPENWIAAVHQYNRSVEYNNAVVEATERYREAIREL